MFADPEHQAVAELLGAYSLDAVDPDEMLLMDEHLARCPRCREEVDQLREVAAALGHTCEEPPAAVWDRIAEGLPYGAAARGRPAVASPSPPPPSLVSEGTRRQGRRRVVELPRRAWVVGAAAVAAAAAIVSLAVSLAGADGQVSRLQAAAGPAAAVHAALASPGHRLVSLRSTGGAREAQLVIEGNGTGYVVTSSLSALPATETYQLWASIDGQPISLGLLGHRVSTGATFSLGSSSRARELMVTVEPADGVVVPSRHPIATADLPVA